jgi:hypothetical protein
MMVINREYSESDEESREMGDGVGELRGDDSRSGLVGAGDTVGWGTRAWLRVSNGVETVGIRRDSLGRRFVKGGQLFKGKAGKDSC